MFIDARKAHLNPKCEEDVYIELPEECGLGKEWCGKLNYWLYGFRPAAAAWEKHYAGLLEGVGFERGNACGVIFYHEERDISLAVHGDDFTFCGLEEDLRWIRELMRDWFDIKVRAILGEDPDDDKEVTRLGRIVRWTDNGIEFEADPKHRQLIMETFGFNEDSKGLVSNGEKEFRQEPGDNEVMEKEEATEFRGVVARMNFLSQDCPDLQFPVKECSKQMSRPTKGAWKSAKKIARYLVRREKVVWRYDWQNESGETYTVADSDWGGNTKERKSTSGPPKRRIWDQFWSILGAILVEFWIKFRIFL